MKTNFKVQRLKAKVCVALAVAVSAFSLQPSALVAQPRITVLTDTNGTLLASSTNLFAQNSNLVNGAVGPSGPLFANGFMKDSASSSNAFFRNSNNVTSGSNTFTGNLYSSGSNQWFGAQYATNYSNIFGGAFTGKVHGVGAVVLESPTIITPQVQTWIQTSATNQSGGFLAKSYSSNSLHGPTVDFARYGEPTSVASNGFRLGAVVFRGYDGSLEVVGATIVGTAAQEFASGANGGKLDFQVTPYDSATPASVLWLSNAIAQITGTLRVSGGISNNGTFESVGNVIGTNTIAGPIAFPRFAITSVANGNNTIDPGTNTFIELSGPTAAFSVNSIQKGFNGRALCILYQGGFQLTYANESGFDATAANRIETGAGGDVVAGGTSLEWFIYSAGDSRWHRFNPVASAANFSGALTLGQLIISGTAGIQNYGGYAGPVKTVTGNYSVTTNDWTIIADTTSAGFTITMPSATGITNVWRIKNIGGNALTVTNANGAQRFDANLAHTNSVQWQTDEWQSDGNTNFWHLSKF